MHFMIRIAFKRRVKKLPNHMNNFAVISIILCSRILWVCILGLVSHGLGIAAQLVASFTDALRTSM